MIPVPTYETPVHWNEPYEPGGKSVSEQRILLQPPRKFSATGLFVFLLVVAGATGAFSFFAFRTGSAPAGSIGLIVSLACAGLALLVRFYPHQYHAVEVTPTKLHRIFGTFRRVEERQWRFADVKRLERRVETKEEWTRGKHSRRVLRNVHKLVAIMADGCVVGIVAANEPGPVDEVQRCMAAMAARSAGAPPAPTHALPVVQASGAAAPAWASVAASSRATQATDGVPGATASMQAANLDVSYVREDDGLGMEQELRMGGARAGAAEVLIAPGSVTITERRRHGWPLVRVDLGIGVLVLGIPFFGVGLFGIQVIPPGLVSPPLAIVLAIVGTVYLLRGARWLLPTTIVITIRERTLEVKGRQARKQPRRLDVQDVLVRKDGAGFRLVAVGAGGKEAVLLTSVDGRAITKRGEQVRKALRMDPPLVQGGS